MKVIDKTFINPNYNVDKFYDDPYFKKTFDMETRKLEPRLDNLKTFSNVCKYLTYVFFGFAVVAGITYAILSQLQKNNTIDTKNIHFIVFLTLTCLFAFFGITFEILNAVYKSKRSKLGNQLLKSEQFRLYCADYVLRCLFDGEVQYDPLGGYKENPIEKLDLFKNKTIEKFIQEDYIVGKHNNVNFECADVVCYSKKVKDYYDKFDGVILTYEYFGNIKLDFEVIVKEKSFDYLQIPDTFEEKSPRRMAEYYHVFDTYVTKGEDISLIVSKKFVENINTICESIMGTFMFYFSHDKLYVFVYGANNDFLFDENISTLNDLIRRCHEEFCCLEKIPLMLNLMRVLPYNNFKAKNSVEDNKVN